VLPTGGGESPIARLVAAGRTENTMSTNQAHGTQHGTVDILALHDRARDHERYERIGTAAVGAILAGAALFTARPLTRIVLAAAGTLLVARGASGLSVKQLGTFVKNLFQQRADLERRFNDARTTSSTPRRSIRFRPAIPRATPPARAE